MLVEAVSLSIALQLKSSVPKSDKSTFDKKIKFLTSSYRITYQSDI